MTLSRGRGCGECYDSGYKGRIAIHELIEADSMLQKLVMKNSSRDELTEYLLDDPLKIAHRWVIFNDGQGS